MAYYEIEWTETRCMRARIQAPPNDERVLEAARSTEDGKPQIDHQASPPEVVVWAEADHASELQAKTYQVTKVGRVEWADSPTRKGMPAMSEERVTPL